MRGRTLVGRAGFRRRVVRRTAGNGGRLRPAETTRRRGPGGQTGSARAGQCDRERDVTAAQTARGSSRAVSPTARDVLRRLRFPLALAALILAAGTAVALLQPHAGPGYLDPHDPGPFGARALAQILAQRGQHVVRVGSPQEAARAAADDATLVITGPAFLDRGDLAAIGRLPGDRVLVEPDGPALRALAPSIIATGTAAVAQAEPDCRLAAAQLAGDAEMGGVTMRAAAPALPPSVTPAALAAAPAPSAGTSAMRGGQACYRMRTGPSLVRYVSGRRTITVLGTGTPLTNGRLADRGDAALALNLL